MAKLYLIKSNHALREELIFGYKQIQSINDKVKTKNGIMLSKKFGCFFYLHVFSQKILFHLPESSFRSKLRSAQLYEKKFH
jgi:hypothetical protein